MPSARAATPSDVIFVPALELISESWLPGFVDRCCPLKAVVVDYCGGPALIFAPKTAAPIIYSVALTFAL